MDDRTAPRIHRRTPGGVGARRTTRTNGLGEFLRARRALTSPTPRLLAEGPRRRVSGLRREEVARLAGVSLDYYIRLEQGRERHPSPAVLDALARVLGLSRDATRYLHGFVAPRAVVRTLDERQVPPVLVDHLRAWTDTPAYVVDSCCEVLQCNTPGAAIHPGLQRDTNMMRLLFLDAEERAMYVDWESVATLSVAWLRAAAGPAPSPWMAALIEELRHASPEFAGLWARHEIAVRTDGEKQLDHPTLGRLSLRHTALSVNRRPGQSLILYRLGAAPASGDDSGVGSAIAPSHAAYSSSDTAGPHSA